MDSENKDKKRFFSIELKSKTSLKNVTMTNGTQDSVLVEGTIGKLVHATFIEDTILEIVGKEGIIRINLQEKELKKEPKSATPPQNLNVCIKQPNQKRMWGGEK